MEKIENRIGFRYIFDVAGEAGKGVDFLNQKETDLLLLLLLLI